MDIRNKFRRNWNQNTEIFVQKIFENTACEMIVLFSRSNVLTVIYGYSYSTELINIYVQRHVCSCSYQWWLSDLSWKSHSDAFLTTRIKHDYITVYIESHVTDYYSKIWPKPVNSLFYHPIIIHLYSPNISWWRHQMETFSALLAHCARNSLVTGEFYAHRPVTRSFDVFFDLRLNKWSSKQSWGWWFETPSRSLWRHCNVVTIKWPSSVDNIWCRVYPDDVHRYAIYILGRKFFKHPNIHRPLYFSTRIFGYMSLSSLLFLDVPLHNSGRYTWISTFNTLHKMVTKCRRHFEMHLNLNNLKVSRKFVLQNLVDKTPPLFEPMITKFIGASMHHRALTN